MCVSYDSRYITFRNIGIEAFTRDRMIGQSITCHLVTRTCLERDCVRSSYERQKQIKSEVKGLILIRMYVSLSYGCFKMNEAHTS